MTELTDKTLAINGGEPFRKEPFPAWPIWDESDAEAVADAIRSGQWGIGGGSVAKFEQAFAAYHHARHAVCLVNGTAALEVALRAIGLEAGDEVIVPPYTFIATASACLIVNAMPVFVDVEPTSYNLDPNRIEEAITDRTRAIIAVHIAGCPADMDAITAIARKHGLAVIEDAAQAVGAEWKGRRVGAIGAVGTFSFQSSKNLNSGEGGACLSDSDELAARCWSLHNVGRVKEGAWYQHPILGWNYRITQMQAALLLNQLGRLEEQAHRRSENAVYLSQLLAQIPGIAPPQPDPRVTRHAWHLYIMRYQQEAWAGLPRAKFIEALSAEGIRCSPGYVPLYKEKAFSNPDVYRAAFTSASRAINYDQVHCPVTEKACREEAIWLYQSLLLGTRKDMADIAGAIAKIRNTVSLP